MKMSDLVERLYALRDAIRAFDPTRILCGEAAAHIEALEAENARLREALQSLLTDWHDCMGHRGTKGERDAIAALAETGGSDV